MTQLLQSINDFDQLLEYLRDELDWPVEDFTPEELSFDYEPEEVGLSGEDAAKVRTIRQLRPLEGEQPWGIFFVEFDDKRLPVTVMRRILRSLVIKKRQSANKAERMAWQPNDLLFITNFGDSSDRAISFAHFVENPGSGLAELRVLGWDDDDTPLHMQMVDSTLKENLRWPDDVDHQDEWRATWAKAFILRHRHAITKSDQLAEELARVAKLLRKRLEDILRIETSGGQIRQLQKAFQDCLIHDMDNAGFADMFAQTVTYGLFSLACRRSFEDGGTAFAKEDLNHYFTSPFLRDMLSIFLGIKAQQGGLDFDEMGVSDVTDLLTSPDTHMPAILADFNNKTRGEDPVIHFYEHFLEAYEKVQRKRRGVYYTPQPVVSYIVRSVHELLQTEFDLKHGLADTTTWGEMLQRNSDLKLPPLTDEPDCKETISPDEPFVQILDPATGTATFLVQVIDVVHQHLQNMWEKGGLPTMPEIPKDKQAGAPPKSFVDYWQVYVSASLLPRLYGYELMMAPYAIAHMKIGLKLAETGYRFESQERAQIYLTNALEPWQNQLALPDFEALAQEAAVVNKIKRSKRFTVVIGNPPYSGISSNMSEYAQHIVDAYKFVDGAALNERKVWLQDDYVKFIRNAQTTIENSKVGLFSYITNHSYLDNPTFRGMRQSLMTTFTSFRALDLHGNTTRIEYPPVGVTDKNVFDIQQGVAVCLATRGGSNNGVEHADLWGLREAKYSWLAKRSVANSGFVALTPDSPYYFFEPQNTDYRDEYDSGWKINEAMPINCAGFITARDHFVVDLDKAALLERIDDFANLKKSDADIRAAHFAGCGSNKYPDGDTRGWKLPEARKLVAGDENWKERVKTCSYRPFDKRKVYWADWMVDWPRPEVSGHMLAGSNVAFHVCRQCVSEGWAHILVARGLIDDCYVSNKSRERGYAHPLYIYVSDGELAFGNDGEPNFAPAFLRQLASALNLPQAQPHNLPRGLTPEDIFHYAYGVFHSPGYRSRYTEFLKIDFPRLPLTSSLELFRELARLGCELTALHMLESPTLDEPITEFIGDDAQVSKVTYTPDNGGTVWIDGKGTAKEPKVGTSGFAPIPEEVWNFHIGGYQVCHKWLKDRKDRILTQEDIAHYHKIVIALTETIRLMAEIDEVIETHGGWPGAFQVESREGEP